MNVSIFTEGNAQLGLGHIIRAIALYQAFEEKKATVKMYVDLDKQSAKLVRRYNHKIIKWLDATDSVNSILSKTDIAVVDSVRAPLSFYRSLETQVKIPVYIDDTLRLDYPRGIFINRTLFAQYFKIRKHKLSHYLLGTHYLPLTKAFWYVPAKKIRKNIEHILITFGGSDPRNMTPKILKSLSRAYPAMKKTVIIGRAFKNIKQIENSQDRYTSISYFPSGEILKILMLDADIAVSAGGQTLYELARIGVPTISVTIIDNQENNVESWQKANFIEHAGRWFDKKLPDKIVKLIEKMQSQNIRLKKSKIGRRLVDGFGSRRIADFVLKKYKTSKT